MSGKNKILTIPNLLSLVRLLMIPLIVWLYCVKREYVLTLVVLALSALTDIVDGMIARKFHMVSDFGKALDPVADKLTQIATLFCLVSRFPYMGIALVILVIKEVVTGVMSLIAINRSGEVRSSNWHGKVTTVLLYATMGLHILWIRIPAVVSNVLITCCIAMMLYSAVCYFIRNLRQIKGEHHEKS